MQLRLCPGNGNVVLRRYVPFHFYWQIFWHWWDCNISNMKLRHLQLNIHILINRTKYIYYRTDNLCLTYDSNVLANRCLNNLKLIEDKHKLIICCLCGSEIQSPNNLWNIIVLYFDIYCIFDVEGLNTVEKREVLCF